jgi:hypothetical protein
MCSKHKTLTGALPSMGLIAQADAGGSKKCVRTPEDK